MTTVARPGTPFPHTHILQHSSSSSSYHAMTSPSYFTQPLHFAPRALPSRTPPSLLNRSASSSSSRSSHARTVSLPDTPALVESSFRRDSTTSVSEESSTGSPVLTTPTLEPEFPSAPQPSPFELSASTYPSRGLGLSLPPPEYNWTPKEITSETSFDIPMSSVDYLTLHKAAPVSPSRPKLKRRDTPRPAITLSTFTSVEDGERSDGHRGKRRLTSAIDGGVWAVLE